MMQHITYVVFANESSAVMWNTENMKSCMHTVKTFLE